MARDIQTIRIDSILGGHTQLSHFGAQGQFRSSLGIDPILGIYDPYINADANFDPTVHSELSGVPSGLL